MLKKNFSAIMKMLKLMIIQPKKQMSLHKKIGYKTDWSDIDFTGWQDIKSDRINIENALKKLEEEED